MKILHIIGILNRGGAETLLMNIYRNINRDMFDFNFLVFKKEHFDYEDEIKKLGGKIIYVDSPQKIGMFKFIKELKQIFKKNKYDVVHAHTLFNCGPCVFAAFLAGIRVRITHSHNTKYLDNKITLKKRIYFILAKILINVFSTHCFACGEKASKFLFYPFRKRTIIKNGIDIYKFKYSDVYNKNIRKKYKIKNNSIVIGNIGRLTNAKNQKFLINMFKEFNIKYPNSYMFLLGEGEDRVQLENMISDYDLNNNIVLVGNVSNVFEYYSAFDVFVLPSLFEGLPLTLIEAQANGVPILISDNISKEVNISNKITFLNLKDDMNIWINKIYDLTKNKRSNNIKTIINNGYSILDTVEKLEKFYGGIK